MPPLAAATWLAASESSPITLVGLAAFIAAVFGAAGWFVNKRSTDDTRSLGVIKEAQISQSAALERQEREIVSLRQRLEAQDTARAAQDLKYERDTGALRAEVAQMRSELAEQLRHHQECEDARVVLEQQLAILRAQIEGDDP